jgi:hypothetical protein
MVPEQVSAKQFRVRCTYEPPSIFRLLEMLLDYVLPDFGALRVLDLEALIANNRSDKFAPSRFVSLPALLPSHPPLRRGAAAGSSSSTPNGAPEDSPRAHSKHATSPLAASQRPCPASAISAKHPLR